MEHGQGGLAMLLQEALTAAVRLRANRQAVSDANSFRMQMKQLLGKADQEARSAGYAGDDVKLAVYAVIVFIDESVLNSRLPMFAEWPHKPLQEEVFGGHMGGELFFDHLQELLRRPDSPDLADLLEVYQLCLLLGLRGRYGLAGAGELVGLKSSVGEKITRIRGGRADLAPSWTPSMGEAIPVLRDPWNRKVGIMAAGTFAFAMLLLVIFNLLLRPGITDVQNLVR
jgi:type VI secretion system protein ImpK